MIFFVIPVNYYFTGVISMCNQMVTSEIRE